MKTPHKHAEVLRAIADGETVQYLIRDEWVDRPEKSMTVDPITCERMQWRIKPKMISLNGFEYPEPLSSAPPKGTVVWTTWVRSVESIVFSELNESAMAMLKQRRLHLTREAAEMHFEAQIKAGGGEV
jgi:hypothetical protein